MDEIKSVEKGRKRSYKVRQSLSTHLRKLHLDIRDAPFFFPFGFVVSLMMYFASKLSLPPQLDRDYLLALLFDHLPFDSAATLMIATFLLVTFAASLRPMRLKQILRIVAVHVARRVSQLSSPAFFVMFGFAFGVAGIGITTETPLYLIHALVFLATAVFFIGLSWWSRTITSIAIPLERWASGGRYRRQIVFLAPAGIAFILLTFSYLDDRPLEVKVSLHPDEYSSLRAYAETQSMPVPDLVRKIALDTLKEELARKP